MCEMIRQFCDFLNTSHSPYHVAKNVVEQLEAAGVAVDFAELHSTYGHDSFLLQPPGYHDRIAGFLG